MDKIQYTILAFLSVLQFKHLLIDFYFQPPWMWKNKGTFGHPGGVVHSALHAVFTSFLVLYVTESFVLFGYIFALEFVAHYLIDYMKMNASKNLNPLKDEKFWKYLGLDQYYHQMTYIIIALIVFKG